MKLWIVRVYYFTKWIEAEAVAKIMKEGVKHFYWKRIMCRYGILNSIVSDNGNQFASTVVTEFCKYMGVMTKLVSVVHPEAHGQTESANKVILKGLKKKLDKANGLWVKLLHEIIWSYHNMPQTTTKQILF